MAVLTNVATCTCAKCHNYKYPKCLLRNAKTSSILNAETCPYFQRKEGYQRDQRLSKGH